MPREMGGGWEPRFMRRAPSTQRRWAPPCFWGGEGWHRPVEEDVEGDGADVPERVGIQHPEQGGEVEQLEQRQRLQQQHHGRALPDVRQARAVPQAPPQPPRQVHQPWGGKQTHTGRGEHPPTAGTAPRLAPDPPPQTPASPITALAAML